MNNYDIKYILRIILNVLIVSFIIYVVARLFIFLLPIIIVLIVLYYVYRIYMETKNKVKDNKKGIKDKVIDAEIIDEKFDK
ncbi:MAG: hypothetical protein IJ068_00200 [Bacilli bacterium]|nr:hypothetical protein [Bacilli bacterium]